MDSVIQILKDTFSLLALPKMTFIDIVEIFIIAFSLYHIIFWVKKTRAWTLLKGIVVLSLIYLVAYFLDMSVIIWLFNKGLAIGSCFSAGASKSFGRTWKEKYCDFNHSV